MPMKSMDETLDLINKNNTAFEGVLKNHKEQIDDNTISAGDAIKATRELKAQNDTLTQEIARLDRARIDMETRQKCLPHQVIEPVRSPGEQFVASAEYKALTSIPGGPSRIETGEVTVELKADHSMTGNSPNDVPGYLYQPMRLPEVIVPGLRKIHVRDVLTVIPTSGGALEYIRESPFAIANQLGSYGFQNLAAFVAESGLKPQSSLSLEVDSVRMATIAHWMPVTRQIIQDAPSIQQYINTRLLYGLRLIEDNILLSGAGPLTSGMLGIMNTYTGYSVDGTTSYAGPSIQLITGTTVPSDSYIDTIRRAIGKVENSNYSANAIMLSPNDWATIELLKTTSKAYVIGNVGGGGGSQYPNVGSPKELWGLPVIVTTAMSDGTFLTGAFDMACSIYDREQAGIRISENVADNFIRNKLVMLAEERLGLAMFRPDAFVKGSFNTAYPNGQ